jgi:hypothetical protein
MKLAKTKNAHQVRELKIKKLYARRNQQAARDGLNPNGSFDQLNALFASLNLQQESNIKEVI